MAGINTDPLSSRSSALTNPEAVANIHSEMLSKVKMGIQQILSMKMKLEPELVIARAQGQDVSEKLITMRNLRLQEICLKDQARRLEERIKLLSVPS